MEILVGDVRDKVAILIDDMCDTGETIKLATLALKEGGARSVYAVVSHGLLSGESMSMLAELPLEKIVVRSFRFLLEQKLTRCDVGDQYDLSDGAPSTGVR